MDAWAGTLTEVNGNADRFLAAGIYGYEFANAAELLRSYPGWPAASFEAFKTMMINAFYPVSFDFLENVCTKLFFFLSSSHNVVFCSIMVRTGSVAGKHPIMVVSETDICCVVYDSSAYGPAMFS